MTIPLTWYLAVAAALFCAGLYAVLARRNPITILMGLALMFNAVILNLVALNQHCQPTDASGKAGTLLIYAITLAQALTGLALTIRIWRHQSPPSATQAPQE